MTTAGVRVFGVSLAVVGVIAVAAAFVPACATGDTASTAGGEDVGVDGSSGHDTGSDAPVQPDANGDVALFETGPSEVPIGSPCNVGDTCAMSGTCTEITPGKSYCTVPCGTGCPTGSYCTPINGTPLCAPDVGNECTRCAGSIDCLMPTDQCVGSPLGDKFCARDCTTLGDCPTGFDCVDAAGYPGTTTPAGDAGTGPRICVPTAGGSCPCDAKRDGVTRTCSVANSFGTCTGTEKCNASQMAFQGCDARTPAAETCNGVDDDCNGQIDDGDPTTLCGGPSSLPPNTATWACTGGMCEIGSCSPGFTDYPVPTDPKTGCACALDPAEPNDSCAAATTTAALVDTSGTPVTLSGTLSSDTDVDVFKIAVTDAAEAGTNSLHVSIAFTAPSPNDEFVIDVMRNTCSDTPSGNGTSITSYDWCVNGTGTISGTNAGEAPCGNVAGQAHCADHSATYYVRVHRKPGVAGTCTQYTLTVGAAGGTCDFSQQCQ